MEKLMNSLPVVSHNLQPLPRIMTRMSSASSPRIHHWKYRLWKPWEHVFSNCSWKILSTILPLFSKQVKNFLERLLIMLLI